MKPQPHILVIGAGPGGTGAACEAARLGAQVTVVERNEVGGTCLNRGCIPTKTILKSATTLRGIRDADALAIEGVGSPRIDIGALKYRKDAVVADLRSQLSAQLARAGITVIKGEACLEDDGIVVITEPDSSQRRITSDALIVATGSTPIILEALQSAGGSVWTSDDALELTAVPDSLLIVGGGVIGVELASAYAALGCAVTIVELADHLLPLVDARVARTLTKSLVEQGIEVLTGISVTAVTSNKDTTRVNLSDGQVRAVARVLCAVGRMPVLPAGFDPAIHVGYPTVVIGDAAGGVMLAHYAEMHGQRAARWILAVLGSPRGTALDTPALADAEGATIPACVYTHPEIATIGLSVTQARQRGHETVNAIAKFSANAQALAENEPDGFVSLVADKTSREILGAQIVGPHAVELIAIVAVALQARMTADAFTSIVFAHPTVSETLKSAALLLQAKH